MIRTQNPDRVHSTINPVDPTPVDDHTATVNQLEMLQRMVEFSYNRLKGLRSGQSSSRGIIQQEIQTLEGKIMKVFSRQMAVKLEAVQLGCEINDSFSDYPKSAQFFDVVEVRPVIAERMSQDCTLEEYCVLSEDEVEQYLRYYYVQAGVSFDADEARRLKSAFRILRLYTSRLRSGEKASDLEWDSWSDTMPESPVPNSRASLSSYMSVFNSQIDINSVQQTATLKVPKTTKSMSLSGSVPHSPILGARMPPLISRSKSDEANIGRRVNMDGLKSSGSFSGEHNSPRKNASRRPGPLNLTVTNVNGDEHSGSYYGDSDASKSRSSSISQSPRTPTRLSHYGMGHSIKHRFSTKMLLMSLQCDYCQKIIFVGVRCKECGFKCHKKCSQKAPPSCGLPEPLERLFIETLKHDSSSEAFKFHTLPNMKRTNSEPSNNLLHIDQERKAGTMTINRSHGNLLVNVDDARPLAFHNPYTHHGRHRNISQSGDSCSTTSSASSVPSSPAMFLDATPNSAPAESRAFYHLSCDSDEMFCFTGTAYDEDGDTEGETMSTADTNTLTGTIQSEVSMQSIMSKASAGTKSTDSTLSGSNEDCSIDNLDSQISDVIPQHIQLRERGSLMSEWVIPFSDIVLDELIGRGRLGEVYKARWHGEVAVKILHVESATEEERNSFKCKVQTLRKTRHENLVLFMGACTEPPTLAIVTSLCKGLTLYQHVHIRSTKFDSNKVIAIIVQIAQGMSYLHARGIVHKDLKTKNVFIDNNRIIITDFGLLSVADVIDSRARSSYLPIPRGWLCYQAPEIVRVLNPATPGHEVNFYTKETDVYAFGSVWFELVSGTWPFEKECPEAMLWQIGKGMKQSLVGLGESRDVKDILSLCWAYAADVRPSFKDLLKAFERLPRKKPITRSPSQPLYMTRSADALIL